MIARSRVEALRDRARTHDAADVRRDDEQVVVVALPHVAEQHGRRVDVVDGDVEKALDLVGVQVHHHHAVDADRRQHVGNDLGGDRHARRARAPVLPRVAEIGDRRGDARDRRALQRIDHHHAFPSGCRWSARTSIAARTRRGRGRSPAARPSPRRRRTGRRRQRPRLMFRCRHTASASFGLALPVKIRMRSKAIGRRASGKRNGGFSRAGYASAERRRRTKAPRWRTCARQCGKWLGRKDSNPRMPESKSGALTNLATPQRKTCA